MDIKSAVHKKAGIYLMALLFLFIFPTAASAFNYTVNAGDTLYSISRQYHTTVDALRAANGLAGDLIHPGQKLVVPDAANVARGTAAAAVSSDGRKVDRQAQAGGKRITEGGGQNTSAVGRYEVKPGDSLYLIGKRFGIDAQTLARANDLTSALIYPGQVLVIPGVSANGMPPITASRGALPDAVQLLARAASLLGRPYVYGAAGPSAFDCSGFTSYVFSSLGINLPHNAAEQAELGQPVDRSALAPGDLVFFSYYGSADIEHVGIYVGNDRFIHASTSAGVEYSSLDQSYYAANYRGARRLLR